MGKIAIGNKLWLEKNGQFFLGKGRVELLKAIGSFGSINANCYLFLEDELKNAQQ
jgi:molybdenum-dependent DNA-binding transcriptional regulator ModE